MVCLEAGPSITCARIFSFFVRRARCLSDSGASDRHPFSCAGLVPIVFLPQTLAGGVAYFFSPRVSGTLASVSHYLSISLFFPPSRHKTRDQPLAEKARQAELARYPTNDIVVGRQSRDALREGNNRLRNLRAHKQTHSGGS